VTALLLLAIRLDLTPLIRGPAPFPPEWQWRLREGSSLTGLAPAIACAIGLLALLLLSGAPPAKRRPITAGALILLLAIGLSFGLQLSMLAMEDGYSASDVLITRTVSSSFAGYFNVALSPECRDVSRFLEQHHSLLSGLPSHTRTHPPGPVLYYRTFLGLFQARPELGKPVVSLAKRTGVNPVFLQNPDEEVFLATALASALTLVAVSNSSCAAVALLAWVLGAPLLAAVRTGILWAFVPGFALMIPEFDHLLVSPVVLSAAVLGLAVGRTRTRGVRWTLSFIAGLVGGTGLLISYGVFLFLAVAGLIVLAAQYDRVRARPIDTTVSMLFAALGATAVFALPSLAGHDTVPAALTALRIHRAEYTAPRSYPTWLLFNLWDFAIFLGFPVAVLFADRVIRSVRRLSSGPAHASGTNLLVTVAAASLLILDLSGTVRGEVGRIWMPLMPFVLVTSLALPIDGHGPGPRNDLEPGFGVAGPSVTLATALAVMLATCGFVLRQTWHLP